MATLSLRVSEEEAQTIQTYVKVHGLNLSSFIRETVLDRIEDDYKLDEARILSALKEAEIGKKYDLDEAWEALGV